MTAHDDGGADRALAMALWLAALSMAAVFVGLVVVNAPSPGPLEFADILWILPIYVAAMMTLPTVGVLIIRRRRTHAIGWLFWIAGLAMAGGFSLQLYGDTALHLHPGLPGGRAAIAIGSNLFLLGMVSGTFVLMFLFPTGRCHTRAWRWIFRTIVTVFGVGLLGSVTSAHLPIPFDDLANPLHLAVVGGATAVAAALLESMAPFVAFLSVASLVSRFRRSRGTERQQMKWFAAAAGFMGGSLAVGFTFSAVGWQLASDVMWVTAMVGLALLPVAVGMAILRYRLYEIDRIVSRTLAYALVTGVLLATYAGAVLLLGRILAPVTQQSEIAVASSTLLVAALFQPLRRRIQGIVDHRFNRSRYDAQRTVADFAAQLRDEVHLDDLRRGLVTTVSGTVQPQIVGVWLAPRNGAGTVGA